MLRLRLWLVAAIAGALAVGSLLLRIFKAGEESANAKTSKSNLNELERTRRAEQDAIIAGNSAAHDAADGARLRIDDGFKRKGK